VSEAFIGEIRIFAGNFAPRGYAFCSGQLLSIAQNAALFSLLGTTYGGDGQVTFALPDQRGRVPIHRGQGPGLSAHVIGEAGGVESVTLGAAQMPLHSHVLTASTATALATAEPPGSVTARANAQIYAPLPASGVVLPLAPQAVASAGGSQPHSNLAPFQCVSFVICLEGIYPTRN
jgi:microcystin-dependent protein